MCWDVDTYNKGLSMIRGLALIISTARPIYHSSRRAMSFDLTYIEAPALKEILQDSAASESIAIIDVRDEDFLGGHIRGATNLPSEEWTDDDKVKELVDRHRGKEKVVLHCMYSKVRGPSCAIKFTEAMQEHSTPDQPSPQILVLKGGFAGWAASCNDMVDK